MFGKNHLKYWHNNMFGKNHLKYWHKICTNNNASGLLFHTSRDYVFPIPTIARDEKSRPSPDCLECLRPATMQISKEPTLAGDPRVPGQYEHCIDPEIYEKWNNAPKLEIQNDWSCYTWWDKKSL